MGFHNIVPLLLLSIGYIIAKRHIIRQKYFKFKSEDINSNVNIKKEFGTNIGYIMDIIADPSDINVINSLIKCVKGQLFQEGVAMVSALSFKQNIFYKNLKGTGFFNLPNNFLPHKSYFTLYNFLESENNFNLNKWHISWGNHDNK